MFEPDANDEETIRRQGSMKSINDDSSTQSIRIQLQDHNDSPHYDSPQVFQTAQEMYMNSKDKDVTNFEDQTRA